MFALRLGLPLFGTLFVVDTSPTQDDIELEASVRARIEVLNGIPKGWPDDWSDESSEAACITNWPEATQKSSPPAHGQHR